MLVQFFYHNLSDYKSILLVVSAFQKCVRHQPVLRICQRSHQQRHAKKYLIWATNAKTPDHLPMIGGFDYLSGGAEEN